MCVSVLLSVSSAVLENKRVRFEGERVGSSPFPLLKSCPEGIGTAGATENAGVENAIRSKNQGWNMREWKNRD